MRFDHNAISLHWLSYVYYYTGSRNLELHLTSLQTICFSKQVICPARDKEASLVGQNMFFHHMFTETGIMVQ